MFLLPICGFLATVVGPSAAFLMIPVTNDGWPAGGTDFWLAGTDDTLWPNRLNASHVGGAMCINANDDVIMASPLYTSGCLWSGYTQPSEGLKYRHFDWQSNITIYDGVIKRRITRHQAHADIPNSGDS
jgi:hypothetical protein